MFLKSFNKLPARVLSGLKSRADTAAPLSGPVYVEVGDPR